MAIVPATAQATESALLCMTIIPATTRAAAPAVSHAGHDRPLSRRERERERERERQQTSMSGRRAQRVVTVRLRAQDVLALRRRRLGFDALPEVLLGGGLLLRFLRMSANRS